MKSIRIFLILMIFAHFDANIQKIRKYSCFLPIKILILRKIIRMKRICFLVDSIFSIGGVQRVTAVIAKELARDYIVTIVTRDDPQQKDTTLYGLQEADIHFRFFTYPAIGKLKNVACKLISGIYQKLRIFLSLKPI